jgi:energy-coupling factor transporter ATPase
LGVIEFANVSYAYPGAQRDAVADIDLRVEAGRVTALLGANGSGKSTLAKMTNGLIAPRTGSVTVDGIRAHDADSVWDVRTRVGMVFQNPDNQIVGTVVEEDVAFGPENLGVARPELAERVRRSLDAVGLSGFERREPHLLSGGQKQRLAIAGALAMDPAYIVFDEAKTMLDPEGRASVDDMVRALKNEGRGILLVTHDLADLSLADTVVVLDGGRVVFAGDVDELPTESDSLESWGLALPPLARTAAALRDSGVPVPAGTFDADGILEALWPSS